MSSLVDQHGMIVCIDGPAGAGKSTVSRLLARRLGFRFLDTGAMYRTVALAAVRGDIDWNDADRLAQLAREIKIDVGEQRVLLDGEDVTQAIRDPEITAATRYAADNPMVREHLVNLQRQAAGDDNVVTEGRDQGTVVFPKSPCKIYLTASPEERARRRAKELAARGVDVSPEDVLAEQIRRDEQDAGRKVGGLMEAEDAVLMATDGLSTEQVVDAIEKLVRQRMEPSSPEAQKESP